MRMRMKLPMRWQTKESLDSLQSRFKSLRDMRSGDISCRDFMVAVAGRRAARVVGRLTGWYSVRIGVAINQHKHMFLRRRDRSMGACHYTHQTMMDY